MGKLLSLGIVQNKLEFEIFGWKRRPTLQEMLGSLGVLGGLKFEESDFSV